MNLDPTTAAAAATPYVAAAVHTFGAEVLHRTDDPDADATSKIGVEILRRLFSRQESAPALKSAVQDFADDPADKDRVAALRLQIRKSLSADVGLNEMVAGILGRAGVTESGWRRVQAGGITGADTSRGDFTVFLGHVGRDIALPDH